MNKIRFAIIGCGKIAQRHAMHIMTYGELVAVCDVIENKAKLLADAYRVPYFISIEDLLSASVAIDVMVICTPNGLHAQQSIFALKNGCHILVEKPMALTSGDCKQMITAAENSGRHLFTVVQNRFNQPVIAVKKALDDKMFGKLYSIQLTCFWNRSDMYYKDSWRGSKEMDGGILFTQFSHFIDLLYWFFGEIKSVYAISKNSAHPNVIAFEDNGVAAIEFENGIIGTINFSINSF